MYRGANWIHGVGKNPIMSIAQATETVALDPEGKMIILSTEGDLIDEKIASKIREFAWESVAEAFKHSNQQKETISAKTSLLSFLQKKVKSTDFSDAEKELCLELLQFEGASIGESIERQSLKFFSLEEHPDEGKSLLRFYFFKLLAVCTLTAALKMTTLWRPHTSALLNISRKQQKATPTSVSMRP